mgnify:CR=1 FL=1
MDQSFNYHIHTYLNGYSPVAIVEQAKRNGLISLGFCEPLPNPDLILPDEDHKLLSSEVDTYLNSITNLANNNQDMTILKGFETGYDPLKESYLGKMREQVDYMILNQQTIKDGLTTLTGHNDPNYPIKYAHAISQAIDSGIFDIIASPDLFMNLKDTMDSDDKKKLFIENSLIASQIICEKSRDMGLPLEIDLTNANDAFWKVASEIKGLQIITKNGKGMKKVEGLVELIKSNLIKDYNPKKARENNSKLQTLFQKTGRKALCFATHLVNQIITKICSKLDPEANSDEIIMALGNGLNSFTQECSNNASLKNKNIATDISGIIANDRLSVSAKKAQTLRKKKALLETDQVFVNQKSLINNTKQSIITAANLGCQKQGEFVNVITQMTEYQTTTDQTKKATISSRLESFQNSKGKGRSMGETKGYAYQLKKPPIPKIPNINNGFANSSLLALLLTTMITLAVGLGYILAKISIGG